MRRRVTRKKPRMPIEGSRGFKRLNFLKKSEWVIVSWLSCEDAVLLLLLFKVIIVFQDGTKGHSFFKNGGVSK